MRISFPRRSKARPRVVDGRASVVVEGTDHMAAAGTPDRVAFIAHWAPDSRISRSVAELTRSLAADGFEVAIISTAVGADPLVWPGPAQSGITILRRSNVGYDFGSWATALDRYPGAREASEVLLLNDSLAGPFRPMDQLLDRFHHSKADVWGVTDTTQITHHLQSYCLGFRCQVLSEPPLVRFFRDVCEEPSREDVIHRYELGLGRLFHREVYSLDATFPYQKVVGEGRNPTIHGWKRLLDLGFPFVKRELLRRPKVTADGSEVPAEVARRFNEDIADWI